MLSGVCCRRQRVWRWTVLLPNRMSCPSLLQHGSRLQCRAAVHPAWHFILLHRGPARPLPQLTEWSAPIPASARMWTVQQHTDWPGERCVVRPLGLPRVRDVLPGRGGLERTTKAPEPTGRAACCPLRVCQPTAQCGERLARSSAPGRRAGMRSLISLEHGRSTARSAFTRPCATLRSATTGANGAGPWECTAGVTPCSHEDPARTGPAAHAPAMALQSPPI